MKEKELLIKLMEIPSISKDELALGNFVFALLETMEFDQLEKIPVDEKGFNILAEKGNPKVMLQAHMDTVSPYIPPTEKDGKIYGRGSCDTKGSMTGMISAAEIALAEGISDFALLFTIGEEDEFRGIKEFVKSKDKWPFAVVGEPSNLKAVNAQYGLLNIDVNAEGKRAHTSTPENGINAIDRLLEVIAKLKQIKLGLNSKRTLSVINGGIQDNIVPDKATALFNLRVAPGDEADYLALFEEVVAEYEGIRAEVNKDIPALPSILTEIPEELNFLELGEVKKGATELAFLKNGIILGPGNLKEAHTNGEFIEVNELEKSSQIYLEIIKAMAQ